MADDQSSPAPAAAYTNPVDDFKKLPKHVREFLEALDKEDVATLAEILKAYQRAAAVGWFLKWLFFFMVSAFMGMVAFGEQIRKFFGWFKSTGV